MPRVRGKLTEMQRRFVQRMLVHGVAVRAAEEAGYKSPRNQIGQLLGTPAVKAELAKQQGKAEAKIEMDRDEALGVLAALARGDGARAKERIAALALLAKLLGWEAPKKLEHSGPGGGAIPLGTVTRADAISALKLEMRRNPELRAELEGDFHG